MPSLRQAQLLHATHYIDVLGAADDLYGKGGEALTRGLALFDLEWLNIQVGFDWAATNVEKDKATAQLCDDYPNAGVHVLALRQHPHVRIRWLEAALAAAQRLNNRSTEGAHLGNLGTAYETLGNPRHAIKYHEQALAIAREIHSRRGESNALGNLERFPYACTQ